MAISTTLLIAQIPEIQAISAAGLINFIVPIVGLVGVCTILWGAYNTVVRQIAAETALRAVNRRRKSRARRGRPFRITCRLDLNS